MKDENSQGIVRDQKGQEQPADKKRAQQTTTTEEKGTSRAKPPLKEKEQRS